jgi:hypothetical protein
MRRKRNAGRTSKVALLAIQVGSRWGRWVIVGPPEGDATTATHGVRARARCDCGRERSVEVRSLVRGKSASCGCISGQRLKTPEFKAASRLSRKLGISHGVPRPPGYKAWYSMIRRCRDSNHPGFHNYGGRGISVCERWKESFWNFNADMGVRPTRYHTIERIDNDGNYEPGNCRWATRKEQARNTRHNVMLTIEGETMCVAAWAERVGLSSGALKYRLSQGWAHERAVFTPRHPSGRRCRGFTL